MSQKPQQANTSDVIKVRYDKLEALREAGRDPFVITTSDRDTLTETIKNNYEEYENKDVCVAGRLLSKRGKGKVSFMDLYDRSGKIQIFAKFDDLGEEEYGFLKKWDIGDIVEVKGFVFKTQMGEISIHAKAVRLLSKSLKPLPEKYHGLTNTDLRYRQRYVDLIMNPEVKDTFIKRSKIISSIRRYLDSQGFMEVETPMLVANAGGASARPFTTHFNALDEDLKLRISLELYLKRLIVGGLEKVYEIGRVFRNEAISARAHCFFHQLEGLYVDKNVSFTDLKQVLLTFARELFGPDTKIRLRPSYFPFTEPSAEMDISCHFCGGEGCAFCKHTGWVEILGCGMVDPNVLEACGIDSKVYTGYAFGLGVERITNLKYRVADLRMFSENDSRFLREFESAN